MKQFGIILFTCVFLILMTITTFAGTWKSDANGWWWDNGNGTYPKNCWQWCDGNNDGIAESYYFDANGYCLRNTTTPDGYTVNADGAWTVNGIVQTKTVGKNTTLTKNGWIEDEYGWKYYKNGTLVKNKIITDSDGCSYIVGEDGYMVYDGWYGQYYVDEDGCVLKNTETPDGYYVGSDGKVKRNSTVDYSAFADAYKNYVDQVLHAPRTCSACNGAGKQVCPSCKGQKEYLCSYCNGKRERTINGITIPCIACSCSGIRICQICSGLGKSECYICDGAGVVSY